VLAFIDGYYREAVSTAGVALERFYEFYLRAATAQRALSKEGFEAFWVSVAAQSERQLGAMMLLHAMEKSSVKLPDDGWRKRRNRVVHKGVFPTRQEAHAFLDETRTVIIELGRELRRNCQEGIKQAERDAYDRDAQLAIVSGKEFSTSGRKGVIGWAAGEREFGSRTLDEEIDRLKKHRHIYWRAPD
jgi:hypothetical protein